MKGPVRDFYKGDTISLGITIKTKLGVHTNPTNGVKVTVIDPVGTTIIDNVAATQDRYNENDTSTAGQFFYLFESADSHTTGNWRVDFLIDDSGTFEGLKVYNPLFRLLPTT